MKLTLDIETYSEENLKSAGLYRYAEHVSTDLLCACWAFDDGPVSAWIPEADKGFKDALLDLGAFVGGVIYTGPFVPTELRQHIESGGEIDAWNASFERNVLNGSAGHRYNFPKISVEQTRCSMARARACSLPGKLEDSADVLETPVRKNTAGLNAMRYLCKPRKDGTRPQLVQERERFLQLLPYCRDDVLAERGVDAELPELSPKEQRVYHMDQRINDRGVRVDLEAVQDIEILIDKYKEQMYARCKEITGISPTVPGKLADWIRTTGGYPSLENLQAETVRQVVARSDVPEVVKTVLRLFSTYNMKAVAKFPAMRKAACKDGRLRGMFGYHAAGTGRWAAYIVQLHNMYRGVPELDADQAILACAGWDLDYIRMLYPGIDPMKIFASCIRGMLIPAEGKELVFPDLVGVEAREVAWVFGEQWKLDAWARGEDTYVLAYLRSFGLPAGTQITKRQRLIGKVLELSMQYEGGVGAFIKMARNYGIDMTDLVLAWPALPEAIRIEAQENFDYATEQGRIYGLDKDVWLACEGLKLAWRKAHPKVVAGWKQLKVAAHLAVANPGEVHKVAGGKIMFKMEKRFLIMRLPSGRRVYYYKPELRSDTLYYQGVDTETRQWQTTSTYGGKLCENQAQGACRDLLVDGMLNFEEAGHDIVGHVHDEPILETPIGALTDGFLNLMMCDPEPWAAGFPVEIEIHRGQRYKKS